MPSSSDVLSTIDLTGYRIWLSGAVPESTEEPKPDVESPIEVWKGADAENDILSLVQVFSALVFKYGGEIVHGCQPSFTPILLEQARRFLGETVGQSPLQLFVSDFFGNDRNRRDWSRWERVASLAVTPKREELSTSLKILRETMTTECNAFVAIGGKWWAGEPGRAGVPIEFEMAKEAGMPCFVLGGFGGVSAEYAEREPEWYVGLNNRLTVEDNQFLAKNTSLGVVAGLVLAQLNRLQSNESGQSFQANE